MIEGGKDNPALQELLNFELSKWRYEFLKLYDGFAHVCQGRHKLF